MTLKSIEDKYKDKNSLFGIIENLVRVKVYRDEDKHHKMGHIDTGIFTITC